MVVTVETVEAVYYNMSHRRETQAWSLEVSKRGDFIGKNPGCPARPVGPSSWHDGVSLPFLSPTTQVIINAPAICMYLPATYHPVSRQNKK